MGLSRENISNELLKPSKRSEIEQAKAQQDWIKFHTDTNLDEIRGGLPYQRFRTFVKSQLPEDKFLASMNNLKFPLGGSACKNAANSEMSIMLASSMM